LVLDLATGSLPVAEAWIRGLHAEICSEQQTYLAHTDVGLQEHELPLGEYKRLPNHVRTAAGEIHSYAPVELTASEMHRLCEELRSREFHEAHPVLQASYAHYALVAVHPFADGNGRVARALASVYTYRANRFPFLVLVDDKPAYFASLLAADRDNHQTFVDFVFSRAVDAVRLIDEALGAAGAPRPEDAVAGLQRLFSTSGGYSHLQVDEAAHFLLEAFQREVQRRGDEWKASQPFLVHTTFFAGDVLSPPASYRRPASRGQMVLQVVVSSPQPAPANVERRFAMVVPRDCGRDDDLLISEANGSLSFGARVDELLPELSTGARLRLAMFVERVLGESLTHLGQLAADALKTRGY
jgi:hypothetical protein